MSVKPVDLQATVPKSSEVGKIAKMKQDEGQARLSEIATTFKGEMEKSQRQVRTPAKAAGARIERDRRSGRQEGGGEKRDEAAESGEKPEGGQEQGAAVDPRKGGMLDVLL
ncbi:MAG: hypothetical protein ACM3X4_04535 [Ignavibacteriales bacterium]